MITLVHDDQGDWIGVYVDGILVDESHSLSESRLLTALGIEHENIYDVDLSESGSCPIKLEDLNRGDDDEPVS